MKIGQPTYSHQFSGSKRRLVEKWDTYQYVPLRESLRQLLLDERIRHEIQSLGNIHPKYRSMLKLINLAIVATLPVIEQHGLNTICKPFINDLNILSTTGISITIGQETQISKGHC